MAFDAKTFEQEMSVIIRLVELLDERYQNASRDELGEKVERFSKCLELCNRKYPALRLSLERTQAECKLGVAVKEESLETLYGSTQSSLPGLVSMGKSSPLEVQVSDQERVKAFFAETCPQLILLFQESGKQPVILTFRQEADVARVSYDPADLKDANSPLRQLVKIYAAKEQGEDSDVLEGLRTIGFSADLGDEPETVQMEFERISEE